jgi:PBP1b-binding outer membrane lipoprotein LpoB
MLSFLFVTLIAMRWYLATLAMLAMAGCVSSPKTAPEYTDAQQECVTTRDVEKIVIKLREEGWSAQRTISSVLSAAQVDDEETKLWFIDLVNRVYRTWTSKEDTDSAFVACMKAASVAGRVLSAAL